ncbi:MAG: DUF309 domain-containing protein [Pirellulales bacterium]|nr:DUF309 domain-containing protein [Pirellulales bacterium]
MPVIPRYRPDVQLPPYGYVTGLWPHPLNHPEGHSHQSPHPLLSDPARQADIFTVDPRPWSVEIPERQEFLYALDLFNHGYYWEAHEAWEGLWQAARKIPSPASLAPAEGLAPAAILALFFQALIKLAAAGVKAREGRGVGVARHLRRAAELLDLVTLRVAPREELWGLNLTELRHFSVKWRSIPLPPLVGREQPVLVVWPEQLRLRDLPLEGTPE